MSPPDASQHLVPNWDTHQMGPTLGGDLIALTRKQRKTIIDCGNRKTFAAIRQGGQIIGSPTVDSSIPVKVTQSQVTDSEEHQWPIHLKLGEIKRFDVGGPFLSTNSFLSNEKGNPIDGVTQFSWIVRNTGLTGIRTGNYETYSGPVLPVDPNVAGRFPTSQASTDVVLDAVGTTAIALCKPTNPVSNVLTAVGEIVKDGLPSLVGSTSWQARTLRARQAGGEYLNVQFGWLPLVSDIKKFAYAVSHSDEILRQYERNAGRIVRRRFNFPKIETMEETLISESAPPFGPNGSALVTITGRLVRQRRIVREQWFSGAFTYWIPPGSDYRSKTLRLAAEARKLYGLSLTPDVLWELAPWSWAIDWFSNAGDVISNLTDFWTQGLAMRYGYVMETSTITDTYILSGYSRRVWNESPKPERTSLSFTTIVKKRRRATPFGFGLNWDGLSPRQLAIIAALGMSRSRPSP